MAQLLESYGYGERNNREKAGTKRNKRMSYKHTIEI